MEWDWSEHYTCRSVAHCYNNHWIIHRKRDGKLVKSMPSIYGALKWLNTWGPERLTGP